MRSCRQLGDPSVWAAALSLVFLLVPTVARGGIFGVPTNLDAQGAPTATSVNPPGWFTINGPNSAAGRGDAVHQVRLFIEVTGTTLDVRIFDPGNTGARDEVIDGSNTRYELFDPAGNSVCCSTTLSSEAGVLSGTTDNRLVRFTPAGAGFYQLDDPNSNNTHFSGLSPGLYELRISQQSNSDTNAFGVDIRVSSTNAAHYNVYTVGRTAAPDTAMILGSFNFGAPPANITPPAIFFPYVTRGCQVFTSNFDADGAGPANLTDALGATTALNVSGGTVHAETTATVETTAATNLESTNYGMWSLTHTLANNVSNLVDWRVADFTGWTNNPAGAPRNPADPLRTYLPNGYAPAAGSPNAVAPFEPILAASARVVSGANPPVVGSTTRFLITAAVYNPTAAALGNVRITIGQPAGVSYVAGTQASLIDGATAACTDGSGAGFRRCTFASLAAGSVASLNIEVEVTPAAAGLLSLTPPPVAGSPPPNSTLEARYTPAFSSSSFSRNETLGPACQLTINVGGGALPTRATIRGVRVDPAGVVEFATGSQRNTAAFNVYATAERSGRGPRRLLHPAPLVAPTPNSMTPVVYRVETGAIHEPYVVIEEIDERGRRRSMGPFEIGDERLRSSLEAIQARLDVAGAPHGARSRFVAPTRAGRLARLRDRQEPRRRDERAPRGVKIEVGQAGVVSVSLAQLQQHGLPPGVRPASLRLTQQGRRVAFDLIAGPDGRPESLRFQADVLTTAYTGRNVYVVTWSRELPSPSVALTRFGSPPSPGFVRVERDVLYVTNAPEDADPWVWDLLFGDGSAWPYDYDPEAGSFDLSGLVPGQTGPIPVRLSIVGRTPHRHTIDAYVNGVAVGRLSFEGAISAQLDGWIDAEALLPVGNQLRLVYTAETTGPADLGLVYLGQLDLGAAVSPAGAPAPVEALAAYDPGIDVARADYLIVTHPLFRDAAERIAALKSADGLRPAVVDVERAYDRFSAGVAEANAVHALIRQAARAGTRYVLLLGDDTFDTRDLLGTGAVSFIPSLLGWDGEFGRVPSENRYADVDDDGSPDVAIGRLPAQTVEEAALLADKIAGQAAALRVAALDHVFAVDDTGAGDPSFRAEAEAVAARLPRGSDVVWADLGAGVQTARDVLLPRLKAGGATLHYFGHAGPEVWADESLLTVEDVAALSSPSPGVLLFTWACEAQWYQYLFGSTIGEALLLSPNGGAYASFGPAGIADAGLQRLLYTRVYRNWIERRLPLGDAIRRAKADALASDPRVLPVVEGWNLLGDPALGAR